MLECNAVCAHRTAATYPVLSGSRCGCAKRSVLEATVAPRALCVDCAMQE